MVTYVADLWEMEISDQQLSPNSGDQGSEIRDQGSGIRDQESGNRDQGSGNREQETVN